jgi:hypothetical protein
MDYNKTAFAPPGCKIIALEKPAKGSTWEPHGQHGYSLGPAMHHCRCQNVYISATASIHIVDMLEFSPHNSPMPQLSSTYPEVPFAHFGDDTITALTQLAEIFKKQFSKTQISGTLPFTYQGRRVQNTFLFDTAQFEFSHAT